MFEFKKAKSYCREPIFLIENAWEAASDTEYEWIIRHRLELEGVSPEQLRADNKWYHRLASELIFIKGEKVNEEYTGNRDTQYLG